MKLLWSSILLMKLLLKSGCGAEYFHDISVVGPCTTETMLSLYAVEKTTISVTVASGTSKGTATVWATITMFNILDMRMSGPGKIWDGKDSFPYQGSS